MGPLFYFKVGIQINQYFIRSKIVEYPPVIFSISVACFFQNIVTGSCCDVLVIQFGF